MVIETGFVVPQSVYDIVDTRVHIQAERNNIQTRKCYVSLGGSGPEMGQAYLAIKHFLEFENEVIVNIGAGDVSMLHRDYRRLLEAEFVKYIQNGRLKLIGGSDSFTREDEVAYFGKALQDPFLTTIITRPNQNSFLVALGLEIVMLDPYQPHEVEAYRYLRDKPNIYSFSTSLQMHNFDVDAFKSDTHWVKAADPENAWRQIQEAIDLSQKARQEILDKRNKARKRWQAGLLTTGIVGGVLLARKITKKAQ